MPLVKCPECGKEISDQAPACIHCGYPINTDKSGDSPADELNAPDVTPGTEFFSVCESCGSFLFTTKSRIENTTKQSGYPTCGKCGGKIKLLARKEKWMKMESADKESIVREEMERVRNGPEFNWEMASRWGNNLRPDLDVQGYCPKCAKYYPKSDALKKGIDRCEFCGTKIRYSDILTPDFTDMYNEYLEQSGGLPSTEQNVADFIRKTFLENDEMFSEETCNQRLHPGQYQTARGNQSQMPSCPNCGSGQIQKISSGGGFLGLFSRKGKKQWHCGHCGFEW